MKFGYSYKTKDGVRHEAIFEANTKEDVFASLRSQGIRPIKVWPIYSRFHVKRSVVVIFILAAALVASLFFIAKESAREVEVAEHDFAPRHQIYGDPALMEELESNGYASVFPDAGDCFLAAYSIPGRQVTGVGLIPPVKARLLLEKVIDKDLEITFHDPMEVRELKLIVNGMKRELREYLSDGEGTLESYVSRLRERQAEEMRIYERVKTELINERDPKVWKERNSALRAMGLRTISRPKKIPVN